MLVGQTKLHTFVTLVHLDSFVFRPSHCPVAYCMRSKTERWKGLGAGVVIFHTSVAFI